MLETTKTQHKSNQKQNLSGQEKGIHQNTKERKPNLDGNLENQRKAEKEEEGNVRNASKSNRKLKPRTADRQQRLKIASLVCLTQTRQKFDSMKSDKISVFGPDKGTSGAKQQLLIIHGAVLGAEAERRLITGIFFFLQVWSIMEPQHFQCFKLLLQ